MISPPTIAQPSLYGSDSGAALFDASAMAQPRSAQVAALPAAALALPAGKAAIDVAAVIAIGLAAWAAHGLQSDRAGQARAVQTMTAKLGALWNWTGQQTQAAQKYLSQMLPALQRRAGGDAAAFTQAVGASLAGLQQRFTGVTAAPARRPAPGVPAAAGAIAAAPARPAAVGLDAQTTNRLKQAAARGARQAQSSMAQAERILHSGSALTSAQQAQVRDIRTRLAALQRQIQGAYSPLHEAGFYPQPMHPVARQIDQWLQSLDSKLAAANRRAPLASRTAVSMAAAGATATPRPAAVLSPPPYHLAQSALPAVQQWGQALQRVVQLPAGATAAQRQAAMSQLDAAGQAVQRRLAQPEVRALLLDAAAAMTPGGAPLPPGNERALTALISGMANALGSVVGDALQTATTGTPVTSDNSTRGALIAFALGAALPNGNSLLARTGLNAFANGAEAWARQATGLDPQDPSSIAISALFGAGAGVAAEGIFRALGRALQPWGLAIEGAQPLRSQAGSARPGAPRSPATLQPPRGVAGGASPSPASAQVSDRAYRQPPNGLGVEQLRELIAISTYQPPTLDPRMALQVAQAGQLIPRPWPNARPTYMSPGSLLDVVTKAIGETPAGKRTLVLHTGRDEASLLPLSNHPNVVMVKTDGITSIAEVERVARIIGGDDSIGAITTVGGAGPLDVMRAVQAAMEAPSREALDAKVRAVSDNDPTRQALLSLWERLPRREIRTIAVPTNLSTTGTQTPASVVKPVAKGGGSPIIVDRRPDATYMPSDVIAASPARLLNAGLMDYWAGISASLPSALDSLPAGGGTEHWRGNLRTFAPEALATYEWVRDVGRSLDDADPKRSSVAAWASFEYSLGAAKLGWEHDLFDSAVSLGMGKPLSHGEWAGLGTVLHAFMYGQMSGDMSLYRNMHATYLSMGLPLSTAALAERGLSTDALMGAIEQSLQAQSGRPSLANRFLVDQAGGFDPEAARRMLHSVLSTQP